MLFPQFRWTDFPLPKQPLSPEANFAVADRNLRSAARQGCHLAVLPEFHLTSWVPGNQDFAASCRDSLPYLERYQALARELHIHIVPGTLVKPVELPPDDDNRGREPDHATELHNLAYFIAASTGDILATYQKKNLWHEERGVLTAGKHAPHRAFDLPLPNPDGSGGGAAGVVRAGLLICWDLAFPEPFRELVADGAELVIVPSFWDIAGIERRVLSLNRESEAVFLDATTVSRAFENTCAVALCNAFGSSQVAVPILGSLGKLGTGEEGIVFGEVDFDTVRYAEEYYKVRADLQGEEWHYTRSATLPAK